MKSEVITLTSFVTDGRTDRRLPVVSQVVSHPVLVVVSHPIFFHNFFIFNLAIMKLFKYFDSYMTVFIMLVK